MSSVLNSNVKQKYSSLFKKMILALIGVAIAGIGVSFNSNAGLGNDPIAVFFDGLRHAMHLSNSQLGVATNLANVCLFILVFIFGRKYIHIGTLIYTLLIGLFVDIGSKIYHTIQIPHVLWWQICSSACGCGMLFLGIAVFISVDIGLDPWTGAVMTLTDITHRPYRLNKVIFDLVVLTIGLLLGGAVGVTTVISAFIGGPAIQKLSNFISRTLLCKLQINP